jgi:hypothetical protein
MVRGRWGKLAVAWLSLAALLLASAPVASAQGEPDTGAFNAFNLKGSNGYRMVIWASSGKRYRHGQILVLVGRKREGVTYFAPARVTDTRVAADLGAFGEIDVTFQPSGEKGVAHPECDRSQRVTYDKGSYVGTIDLHGEEGYTRVRASSVPLALHPFIDFICGGSGSGESLGYGLPGARLRARAKFGEGGLLEVQANQNRPGARVKISVSASERRDRVKISREVSSAFPATALDFAPSLRTATLAPPAPFSGFARFQQEGKPANRWTGNLTVDFPGRSHVSLVGARFRATLVHARLTEENRLRGRPNLPPGPSTKSSPTAFATPSFLAPR